MQFKKEDLKWILAITSVVIGTDIQASVFDWSADNGWDAGALTKEYTNVDSSNIDVNVTITGDTSQFVTDYPDDTSDDVNTSLDYYVDFSDTAQSTTTTLYFSVPVQITNLQIRDIDYANENGSNGAKFEDRVIINALGEDGNVYTPNIVSLGDNVVENSAGDYEADGTETLNDDDPNGYVTVEFSDQYITELNVTYTSGTDTPSDDPTGQHVLFDNLNFFPKDTDNDGVPDFQDIDDDNDGILDSIEMQGGGNCSYGFLQVISGQLKLYDVIYRSYIDIGETKVLYNAMGYNSENGKLYASVRESGSDDYGNSIDLGDLIEIDRYSGKIKLVYNGDRTASGSANSATGAFYDGKLYYRNADDNNYLYAWDKKTNTTEKIGSTTIDSVDMGIVVDSNGEATGYGANTTDTTSGAEDNTEFYVIDLTDGTVTTYTMTVTTPDGNDLQSGWGAVFVTDNDTGDPKLYMANNEGYIYRIDDFDTATPTAVFMYRSEATNSNDGASCRDADQFPPDSDGDGLADYLDLDSDNDGVPDNIEAQSTETYVAPSSTDSDGDGLSDAYDANTDDNTESIGLVPSDSDNDGIADFLDNDSDNDGYTDCEEGHVDADCSNLNVGNNGLASWADNSEDDYSDPNGNIDDPETSGKLENETGDTTEAAYREFLCGKTEFQITEYQWRLISIPCDTGSNTIDDLFGGILGTYGDTNNWVMYEQTGTTDNYEVNDTHKNTDKTQLDSSATLEIGKSYWIIADANHTITIDKTLDNLTPTSETNSSDVGINDDLFSTVHEVALPANSADNDKKYMTGNPFPYRFDFSKLYFKNGNGDYAAMGDSVNDAYILGRIYTHDSSDTSDKNESSGGGYKVISPATPGLAEGQIVPMEGFFIKLETQADENSNSFAFPLMMQYGN